ncbi:hypothetical protein Krac_7526 [Ktedonobacter racemifer DSM 44963]|uniref:Uncharacterized protein n=1 Tax=Ktedonobacter racemifer DSM 44963 TaxID=485913 RepID=D6TKD5_KTERA|nr:hypothetical protein Krac_7526 [Ktedonobacter racemifer DSM 44963]
MNALKMFDYLRCHLLSHRLNPLFSFDTKNVSKFTAPGAKYATLRSRIQDYSIRYMDMYLVALDTFYLIELSIPG